MDIRHDRVARVQAGMHEQALVAIVVLNNDDYASRGLALVSRLSVFGLPGSGLRAPTDVDLRYAKLALPCREVFAWAAT